MFIVEPFARRMWWLMMWFMRRPLMHRIRFSWIKWVPEHKKEKAWANFCSQERFARKYGLMICRYTLGACFLIFLTQCIAAWVYIQQGNGGFDVGK